MPTLPTLYWRVVEDATDEIEEAQVPLTPLSASILFPFEDRQALGKRVYSVALYRKGQASLPGPTAFMRDAFTWNDGQLAK